MHFTRHQHIVLQFIIQRAKLLSHDVNPAPHRIAVQLHALAGIDFRLTVQRQMLGELSHDYAGQQSRTGVTALDGFWWLRSLNYTVAPAAGQFWANRFDYPERGVDDIQLFRDAFSQRFQFAAADGAFGFCRGDNLPVTGKCCRKCFADGRV
ncbi:hypothetical protein EC162594_05124 [Escherichia coli O145:H28]|nr:hypothetical protein BvCmsHHP013_05291 [Escherichia coli]GEE16393.1 hypothetical protein ECH27V05_04931 [Escherichia coli O145:H28]GDG83191.1 hypothetical protein BvCmsKKP002_05413 [Escherichia coli]GDH62374.1 hypothetical protein BvCmsKKP005_04997 [Escherichia coli]GDJ22905.1 hypothetical protein BvCmsKSP008_05730 [Escherichia coli]